MAWGFRRHYRPPRRLRTRVLLGLGKVLLGAVLASALLTLGLRWIDPPTTAFMLRSSLSRDAKGRSEAPLRHYWVDWADISDHAKVAVLAAEDQRFSSHSGFDLDAIADAAYARVKRGHSRGASTISQQVAKNLYLWPGQSFVRKGLEAYHTALIELLWPKRRILEVYLNVAQFGDRVFGIEAASVRYFGKPSSRLTRREAALLAAVLPSPRRYRVSPEPSPYLESRSRWILTQMDMLGGEAYLSRL